MDDERDTGPPHGAATGDAEPDWWTLFDDREIGDTPFRPDLVRPRRRGRRGLLTAMGAALILLSAACLAALALIRPAAGHNDERAGVVATPLPGAPDSAAENTLRHNLPRGFGPDACAPAPPRRGATASLKCEAGVEISGPTAAIFVTFNDPSALRTELAAMVGTLQVVPCPGGIQSPGPWHHNADPSRTLGTLVCGYRDGNATITWSTDAEGTIGSITREDRADPDRAGPLTALMRWWSSR